MTPWLEDDDVTVYHGDCLHVMAAMAEASVDAVVCDPPYGLEFMGKEWDRPWAVSPRNSVGYAGRDDLKLPAHRDNRNANCRACGGRARGAKRCGCANPEWDRPPANDMREFQAWCEAWGREALRVLKPGGHLLAFGGTRTSHRLVCGLEDAGFEIRDSLVYMYGSGFPKSLNLDNERGSRVCGCEAVSEHDLPRMRVRDVPATEATQGRSRALLLESVSESGSPAHGSATASGSVLRSSEPGVEGWGDLQADAREPRGSEIRAGAGVGAADGPQGRVRHGAQASRGDDGGLPVDANGSRPPSEPRPTGQRSVEPGAVAGQQEPQTRGAWPVCDGCGLPRIPRGLGTSLKPAHEPVVVARKPLAGTVAGNVLAHGTGALNIDGCRVAAADGYVENAVTQGINTARTSYEHRRARRTFEPQTAGRWPANVVLDETAAEMLDEQSGQSASPPSRPRSPDGPAASTWTLGREGGVQVGYDDRGGASRFFYTSKADSQERRGSKHPTVKPLDLMRWLVRLVTPPGGTVLDPFAGSGTTLEAARAEGFRAVGIEREAEYLPDIAARLAQLSLLVVADCEKDGAATGEALLDDNHDLGWA